jgi:hypothetical protein
MKKIIFIGGTARSGSTLLDKIISNDPIAMSLGEIHAIFHPTRKHHFVELKLLENHSIWSKIIRDGKKSLYRNLVKYFPKIDVFVDSSKDPFWFNYHRRINTKEFYIYDILIHKTPEEIANSYIKRGHSNLWNKVYIDYHEKYFSLIDNFFSIAYKDIFFDEDESLIELCSKIGMNYYPEKKLYWKSKQTTFFGSNSVKSKYSANKYNKEEKDIRKDITYDKPCNEIVSFVQIILKENSTVRQIQYVLENSKLGAQSKLSEKMQDKLKIIKSKKIFLMIKRNIKYKLKFIYFTIKGIK